MGSLCLPLQFIYRSSFIILVETYNTIMILMALLGLPTGFRPVFPGEQGVDHQPDDCPEKHCHNTDKSHFFPELEEHKKKKKDKTMEYQYDNGKYAAPGALRP
jgi:hypothetical protein